MSLSASNIIIHISGIPGLNCTVHRMLKTNGTACIIEPNMCRDTFHWGRGL